MKKITKQDERVKLLLKEFNIPRTVNEAIDRIWTRECLRGTALARGPKFYNHLNKLPSKMESMGLIEHIGFSNKEKIWSRK